jgi:hypothetical protein
MRRSSKGSRRVSPAAGDSYLRLAKSLEKSEKQPQLTNVKCAVVNAMRERCRRNDFLQIELHEAAQRNDYSC